MEKMLLQAEAVRSQLKQQVKALEDKKQDAQDMVFVSEEASEFLKKVAMETQQLFKVKIEYCVQLLLDALFPGEYLFQVDFVSKAGRVEADLVFVSKHSGKRMSPLDTSGGGVCCIASFALRMSLHLLQKGSNNVLVFDEPFNFVSADRLETVNSLIEELSSNLGVQVIMVTHQTKFIESVKRAVIVSKVGDVSKVQYRDFTTGTTI
jgi:DNA repair exonuclease SbcCD ATPase subunit